MADALGVSVDRYRKYEIRSLLPHALVARFAEVIGDSVTYIMTGRRNAADAALSYRGNANNGDGGGDSDGDEASGGGLTQLGRRTPVPTSPADAVVETVANPQPGRTYLVRLTAPEFTTLCPITGQPDFAHMVVDYVPAARLIESKSFKLFLASFRNHADFHEACTLAVADRLIAAARPHWLRIGAYWYPRGGIPIDVFWQTGTPPEGLWLPDQGVAAYRGRG